MRGNREGWSEWDDRQVLRRRYLARFATPAKDIDVVTVFETGGEGWIGVTAFGTDQKSLLQLARHGKRIYQRGRSAFVPDAALPPTSL